MLKLKKNKVEKTMFWGKYYIKVCCMRRFCLLVIKIHYVVLLPYIRITCPSRPDT